LPHFSAGEGLFGRSLSDRNIDFLDLLSVYYMKLLTNLPKYDNIILKEKIRPDSLRVAEQEEYKQKRTAVGNG